MSASAADQIVTKSEVVQFGDLNLGTEAGTRTLYGRIRAAARKVCSDSSSVMHFERLNYLGCYKKAVDDAVNKVNRPTLTAMHRSGNSRPTG